MMLEYIAMAIRIKNSRLYHFSYLDLDRGVEYDVTNYPHDHMT